MSHVEVLARIPLFSSLPEEDLARISSLSREESYPNGANIVKIGDPGETLFVVLEGTVQVLYPGRSQDLQLARLEAGEFFGEMALLNDEPRSATVRAMTPVRALVVEKDDFRDLIRSSGGVALSLLEALSYRVRNVGEQAGELHEQMLRDPLTGLLNRRAFQERVQEETNRAQRYGDPFSLLILDVDQFRVVNDTFGHDVGDQVLQWIGRILGEHTRAADAPFRIGGEEFAVLAPSAPPDVAEAVAERVLEVIAETRPPLENHINITMSIGYATCPDHARRSEALFRLADQAVVRAKAQGRNRVVGPGVVTSSDRGPGPEDRRSSGGSG